MMPMKRELSTDLYDQAWAAEDPTDSAEREVVDSFSGFLFGIALGLVAWGAVLVLTYLLVF
jgi:hypothetical protein